MGKPILLYGQIYIAKHRYVQNLDGATLALSELPNGNLAITAFVVDDSALAASVAVSSR